MYFSGLGAVLVLFCIYWLYFYFVQRQHLFPAARIPFDCATQPKNGQSVWLELPWGHTEVWWLPALKGQGQLPVVIVAHGQSSLIDTWEQRLTGLRQMGYHCLLVEFPGYGRSSGEPSEQSFSQTFCAAYDWVLQRNDVDKSKIIGLGRSMGGGVISLLAEQRRLAGLWLLSTFTSLRPFIRRKGIPASLLRDPLDNLSRISDYQPPAVIIHGVEDRVISHRHSERLAKAAPESLLILEKSGHDNCPLDWDKFWAQAIKATFP